MAGRVLRYLIAAAVLCLGAPGAPVSAAQPYPPHAEDVVLVEVAGVPFLIPRAYFSNPRRVKDGPASELGLHASLPDIGDDGEVVAKELGFGRYLRIGVFPPELYTEMRENRTYPEQVGWNLATGNDLSTFKMTTGLKDIDFRQTWAAFVEANKFRHKEIIDVSIIFGWDRAGLPPRKNRQEYYIAFEKDRLVLFMDCDKPEPGRNQGCWAYYQRPGDRFALRLSFSRTFEREILDMVERVNDRLQAFHADALDLLGSGRPLRSGETK